MKIMYQLRGSSTVMAVDGEVYMVIWDHTPAPDKPGGYDRSDVYLTSDPLEAWTKFVETVDMEVRRKINRWKGAKADAERRINPKAPPGGTI